MSAQNKAIDCARLLTAKGISVAIDQKLSKLTTYKIGGLVDLMVYPSSADEVITTVQILNECEVDFDIIGGGSNILAPDDGYRGALICLKLGRTDYEIDEMLLKSSAGIHLSTIVRESIKKGMGGLEFLAGIPGTVGGAVAMNAGTAQHWLSSIASSVTYYDFASKSVVEKIASELEWGYRFSSLRGNAIILEAAFNLRLGQKEKLIEDVQARLEKRKAIQPLSLPNAGSIFRNPDGDSAGRLIEAVGLKGYKIGGAQISTLHANFIVNVDNATARDVTNLIDCASQKVEEAYGIRLQKEIYLLGSRK